METSFWPDWPTGRAAVREIDKSATTSTFTICMLRIDMSCGINSIIRESGRSGGISGLWHLTSRLQYSMPPRWRRILRVFVLSFGDTRTCGATGFGVHEQRTFTENPATKDGGSNLFVLPVIRRNLL